MSLQQIPLPSPPPDHLLRGPMSGIFARSIDVNLTSDGLSEPITSDSEYVTRKKVDFHPFAQNICDAPQLSTPDSEVTPSLKSLPPSRDCQPTSRPILKQTQSLESVMALDVITEKPNSNMDSLLQHLAGNDRPSLIDAYQTITNLIKMYDEPPEQEVLRNNMIQLQKFVRRDLVVLDGNTEDLPSEQRLSRGNLVMSALKVTVTVVWSPLYAPYLTDDFRIWILERSIQLLKEHTAPKATLLHYMHLLATQNFRPQIISHNNRCLRILEVVQELTDHVSGKAVAAERLLIYQKLIDQAKSTMKSRADLWLKNVLSAMGHSFKEVRSNAISAGSKACTVFGGASSLAAYTRKVLAEVTNERSLSNFIAGRLERLFAAKDEACQIPQIWTIILMLCNSGGQKLDSWPQLHEWLKVIQRCFNCSDTNVRIQSFLAWNRLYYVARPHEASDKIVSMLAKPPMIQLDRTAGTLAGKGSRQAVTSSYCMLLYYAFRPAASHAQYTRMWNEFVVKLMTRSFLSKSSANCDLSCRVLAALFYTTASASRVWNENRAHENSPLDPQELPAVDCKWIKTNFPAIMSIVRLLIDYGSFGPDGKLSDLAYVAQTWRNLMKAFRESISKEIKASADTKAAWWSIFTLLRPAFDTRDMHMLERLYLLSKIAIEELGPSTVLQAMEGFDEKWNTVLLKEIVQGIGGHEGGQAVLYGRCLKLLKDDLESLNHADAAGAFANIEVLRVKAISEVLEAFLPESGLTTLSVLQNTLISFVERFPVAEVQQQDSQEYQNPCSTLCYAIAALIQRANIQDNAAFDRLLYSLLLRGPSNLRESLLAVWATKRNTATFRAEVSRLLAEAFKQQSRPASADKVRIASNDDGPTPAPSTSIACVNDASKLAEHKPVGILDRLIVHKRITGPRHDDSQVQCLSIESSPPEYENMEPQPLTANQKDLRARPQSEPVLMFADIRSSPSTGKRSCQPSSSEGPPAPSPELPATPTLPHSKSVDHDEHLPTPTPKARKPHLLDLQPDVPSSPPSVIEGEPHVHELSAANLSPYKRNQLEDENVVRLDSTDDLMEDVYPRELQNQAVVHCVKQQKQSESEMPPGNRLPFCELAITEADTRISSNDQYETAGTDALSSETYSDEYDAMAASQLSQGLAEESCAISGIRAVPAAPVGKISKRKRNDTQQVQMSRKRSRPSLDTPEADTASSANPSTAQDEDMLDCIVVNMEHTASRSQQRKSRTNKIRPTSSEGPRSRAQSQSTKSSLSASPTSSITRRGKRASRRRTQSSQQTPGDNPVHQVPVEGTEQMAEEKKSPSETYVVAAGREEETDADVPLLGDEVPESLQKCIASSPDLTTSKPVRLVLESTEAAPAQVDAPAEVAQPDDVPMQEEDMAFVRPQKESATQATNTEFNVVSRLQDILDQLNSGTADWMASDVDLAAVHALCFKIGLKTQELVSALR